MSEDNKNKSEDELIRNKLKFFKDEFISIKESKKDEQLSTVIANFRDLIDKISFSYRKHGMINNDIDFVTSFIFNQYRNDDGSLTDNQKNDLENRLDRLIYSIDLHMRSPDTLHYKKFPPKGGKTKAKLFEKIFGVKDSKSNGKQIDAKPLEFDVIDDDHSGKIKVFISHKFVEPDQKLARTLQESLKKENIFSYVENRNRDYDLVWGEKIKRDIESSDYLVAIITKYSQNAPSIHQEMGYALGVKVPVRIMAEEQEAKGVLFEGKDVEKFSRDNFEKYLDNIIKDVLKKGFRKKISDKEKAELIQNVYEPCYNQIMNVYKKLDFIIEVPPNPWEKISHSWQLRTESDMRELFDEYTKELKKWQPMWMDFGNKCIHHRKDLGDALQPIFENFHLLNEYKYLYFGEDLAPQGWIQNSQDVLFNPQIQNGEELYKILKDHAMKRWGETHAKYFDKWNNENPQIYSEIVKAIPNLIEILNAEFTYQEIDDQRNILKNIIEKLTLELEKKLK